MVKELSCCINTIRTTQLKDTKRINALTAKVADWDEQIKNMEENLITLMQLLNQLEDRVKDTAQNVDPTVDICSEIDGDQPCEDCDDCPEWAGSTRPDGLEYRSCCHQFKSLLADINRQIPGLSYNPAKFCIWCGRPFDETWPEPKQPDSGDTDLGWHPL